MNLIGQMVDGKPQLEIDLRGSGKYILMPLGSKNVYGPFDTLEEAQAWAKAKAEELKGAA